MKIEKLIERAVYVQTPNEERPLCYYTHAVTCKSRFMSGWGVARDTSAWDVVLCHGGDQCMRIMRNMEADGDCMYVNFYNPQNIPYKSDRVYSIRFADSCPIWNHA